MPVIMFRCGGRRSWTQRGWHAAKAGLSLTPALDRSTPACRPAGPPADVYRAPMAGRSTTTRHRHRRRPSAPPHRAGCLQQVDVSIARPSTMPVPRWQHGAGCLIYASLYMQVLVCDCGDEDTPTYPLVAIKKTVAADHEKLHNE